ncbi:MAG: ASKHA domain-containing protein [Lentisphaeria bacterium]
MTNRKEVKVTFQPSGRSVYVLPGTLLLEAAGRAGIVLQTPCGGQGTCGKCKIRIVDGKLEPSAADKRMLSEEQIKQGIRLACQTYVETELIINVPKESRFEAKDQILTSHMNKGVILDPVIQKQFFQLETPTSEDAVSDTARLKRYVGDKNIPYYLLRKLPKFLRSHDWEGTAVMTDGRILGLEPGDTSDKAFGVAIDVGTTTIVGTLFDLNTGDDKAVASTVNPQVSYGDDVISRIMRLRENHDSRWEMKEETMNAINNIVKNLSQKIDIEERFIYEIVIAGNSTMQQILCGLDSAALGEVPFVQVFDGALSIPAKDLGLATCPGCEIFIFPQIGGFVGGDTVAGMLATQMDKGEEPTLLVDIGTNGEIVLADKGNFYATSTAAGPAFEGARIVQGMRATAGAIEKVVIKEDVDINVIGNAKPVGLCGTALIDTVAELLRKGLIEESGRIISAQEAPEDVSDKLRSRLVDVDGQTNFLLADAAETSSGEPVYLWQKDVRELQLATGAVRAGINLLLRRLGLEAEDLGSVLLAGAFGNFIRRNNARRIGLLPQVRCGRIQFIGNAASLGAKLALLSGEERLRAEELRSKAEHIDLSLDPEFQMEFGEAMMFPSKDIDACPDP